MCGIAGIFGTSWNESDLTAMVRSQHHRGPDADGMYVDAARLAGLGHNRLSIIDLSDAGIQPMVSPFANQRIVFNGEIYNYLEIKRELESEYSFATKTDTEVLLAAYNKWGEDCLDRLIGMFAFIIWDENEKTVFAARDRFGVKPLYYHRKPDGTLLLASEIKAIHAAGISRNPNESTWATYFTYGLYDHSENTFWKDVFALPAGHKLRWRKDKFEIAKWYDIAARIGDETDERSEDTVREELLALLKESVNFRFRADVPVGINLSGGLDSSSLLSLVQEVQGKDSDVKAFTYVTGDENYDELPWVEQMLQKTRHPLHACLLKPEDVPAMAASVQHHEDEPFGGLPTLAYARLFEIAKSNGVKVLLDGNGMDEQWCGYDYYQQSLEGKKAGLVQGTREKPVRGECLIPDFRNLAEKEEFPVVFRDPIRNLQYRDTFITKIPRALRFNDRVSMRSSTELREPFLDHRLFELAFRQPTERKLSNGTRKKLLREAVEPIVSRSISQAPKRPLQTPQREWLRSELRGWVEDLLDAVLKDFGGKWFDSESVMSEWANFRAGNSDNSFYVWQWISLAINQNYSALSRGK